MKNQIILLLLISVLFIACSQKREKITALSQLKNKRICILTGSAGDLSTRNAFPEAVIIDMVSSSDAALSVKTGKSDAFVYDKSVLLKIVEKNPELTILDEPVSNLAVAAAIRKENAELAKEISSVFETLRKKGILDSLKSKWVNSGYKAVPALPNLVSTGVNGNLRMGTCAIFEPFTFQSNGQLTGLDIELSRLIGQYLGKNIEIIDMSFEGLIPALQAGKIDFALSNFNITEERKKLISYSSPYLENDISALVRK